MKYIRYFPLFLLFLVACQSEPENNALSQGEQNTPFMNIDSQQEFTNSDIANHLAEIASRVPDVNRAHAVVAGPYAVVGIDVDGELDRSRVGTIKFSVSEALQHDPYGKTAIVVADADLTDRFQAMNDKIRDGHPIRGIIDELAAIVGRYMPDLPLPDEQPQDDQQKENMSDTNEEKLHDLEKEQSNNNL